MKNYLKMTLFAFFAISLLIASVSALLPSNTYTYTDRDSFAYREDMNGNTGGFSIAFTDSDTATYPYRNRGYYVCGDHYSWRSHGCGRYYDDRPYYVYDSYSNLDHDAVLKEAFKTYQQRSKQEYQLETRRIALEERRRYSYGGYGYGYSGARYYSYGW